MKVKEIIDGLKFTVGMFLFDPTTGETLSEPRNDMDKTTIDACKGAIELLEQKRWIPVSERLPETDTDVLVTNGIGTYIGWIDPTDRGWRVDSESEYFMNDIVAWMPLPEPYKTESEE